MTVQEAIETLEKHKLWWSGTADTAVQDPKQVTKAIETLIEACRNQS